jgi:hypothetical protein
MPARWNISGGLVSALNILFIAGSAGAPPLSAQAPATGSQPKPSAESCLDQSLRYCQAGQIRGLNQGGARGAEAAPELPRGVEQYCGGL